MEDGVTTLRAQRDRLLDASQLLPEHRTNMRSESDRFLAALLSDDEATVREILGGPAGHLILPPYGFVPGDPTGRIRFALSPWYRSQVLYDIGATLSAIGVPVYAAYGSLDQVIDAPRSVALLRQRLGHEARIELIDGLNHLMMPAATGIFSSADRFGIDNDLVFISHAHANKQRKYTRQERHVDRSFNARPTAWCECFRRNQVFWPNSNSVS